MAKIDSIKPFPVNVDRNSFGHWLSGFTDGEGCFRLRISKVRNYFSPGASFTIGLRADDFAILERIQSFFGTGYFNNTKAINTSKPGKSLCISRPDLLVSIVVPHFERFPLRSKKSRDFTIWKRGVQLLHEVTQRKRRGRGRGRGGVGRGIFPKWTEEERSKFSELVENLRVQRQYV